MPPADLAPSNTPLKSEPLLLVIGHMESMNSKEVANEPMY
jgi:hypothetical protein